MKTPRMSLLLHLFIVQVAMEMVEDQKKACNDNKNNKEDDTQDETPDNTKDDKEGDKEKGKDGAIYTRWGSHDCPEVKVDLSGQGSCIVL